MSSSSTAELRQATSVEVATFVKMFRKMRGWSQDTLATLARSGGPHRPAGGTRRTEQSRYKKGNLRRLRP